MNNRIIESYLKKFKSDFDILENHDESKLFELFTNYTILESFVDSTLEYDQIQDINIGDQNTIGLDGFAIVIDRTLITSEEELKQFLDDGHNIISCNIIFSQCKTGNNFSTQSINFFLFAVKDFISNKREFAWSAKARKYIALFDFLYQNSTKFQELPCCYLYYATLGNKPENDQNIDACIKKLENDIKTENVFSKIKTDLLGANEIQLKYKKIGQAVTQSFEYSDKITLPDIPGANQAFLGIINAKDLLKLICKEDELFPVFEDNVRDFLGNDIKVNQDISSSIKDNAKHDSFVLLNNGITILAEKITIIRNTFTLYNYQIINGCQTSHILFELKEILTDSIKIPLKLIESTDQNLVSSVIKATNSQNAIKTQDMIAYSTFQKNIEEFFKTSTPQLLYERRSKQYTKKNIDRKKIIDKTNLIKAISSMFFNQPAIATRYFGTLWRKYKDKLFQTNHDPLPYYTSALALYKIDELFRIHHINNKYKKFKFYILMLLKFEITKEETPNLSSKKINNYTSNICTILNNDQQLKSLIDSVIQKFNTLDIDLDDTETSKSNETLVKCMALYKN